MSAGCANVEELEKFALEGDQYSTHASASSTSSIAPGQFNAEPIPIPGTQLLAVESIITGGNQADNGMVGQFRRLAAGAVSEIHLSRPVAVGGVDNLLYIVDAVQGTIFKYDLSTQQFLPMKDLGVNFNGDPGNIYVTKDHSFYVVDSSGRQVLHFSEDGDLLGKYQDLANLSRPMDVLVHEPSGEVYVADGSFSHIVVFSPLGNALRAVGRRGTGEGRFRAITSMTAGDDGIYVLDRLELPVQVFTWDGVFRYSFGVGDLTYPTAVAVDQHQRVYISDQIDNMIRVYQDGQLLEKIGDTGNQPGQFRMVTGMWASGDRLYVADSLNHRVQVLKIRDDSRIPGIGMVQGLQ